ncbi:neurogenic locus notch homolog protein 1-like [Rhopilema esculentum]|uniref:neurogenic locus notch homolog protein 1-like n=1 Tax=Rhopilema esculentum TaxID=499914 RepID=UPI0031DEA303
MIQGLGTSWKMILYFYLLLCLSIFIPSQCRILRLPCKMIAEFKIVHRGYWLQGSVIAEFTEAGLQDCYGYCLHNPSCKSFNIEKDDYGTCQLNPMSSHDVLDKKTLTPNGNWNFHSTNFSDRNIGHICKSQKPCKDDEICLDTCSCPGYQCFKCVGNIKGLHCNRCASQPCRNGGTCEEKGAQICRCAAGFEGPFCQQNVNECSSNPCVNGNCVDLINGYKCICHDGWTGSRCDQDIDECASNPCEHGTCRNLNNGFQCECPFHRTGTYFRKLTQSILILGL